MAVMAGAVCWAARTPTSGLVAPILPAHPVVPSMVELPPAPGVLVTPVVSLPRIPLPPEPKVVAMAVLPPIRYVSGGAPDPVFMRAEEIKYGLTPGILHAIAILESSDGVQACGNNDFGWRSCAVDFVSVAAGIETVAHALAQPPYAGLPVRVQLCIYESGRPCTTAAGAAYGDRGLALLGR